MKLSPLPWETELLGVKSGRLEAESPGGAPFDPGDYHFVLAKLPGGDEGRVNELVGSGFRLIETALTFRRDAKEMEFSRDEGVAVCEADAGQVEEAARIAFETFEDSRFHRDPEIPERVARESRSSWVRNAREEGRGRVLVAGREGRVDGFLVHRDAAGGSLLDLIGVRPSRKRSGVATALVAGHLLRFPAAFFQVTTQASNHASIALYRKTGYLYHGASYTLHWHRPR